MDSNLDQKLDLLIIIHFKGSQAGAYSVPKDYLYGPRGEKTCLWGFSNYKGTDQPAHMRSLISASVIGFLESIITCYR